jgi:hypothetical protein
MTTAGYPRRLRFLVVTCARLAFFIYVFQVAAVDHWHNDPNAISGLRGSALHASHCHAEQASCADSAGPTTALTQTSLIPIPPTAIAFGLSLDASAPDQVHVLTPTHPPRGA